MCNKHQITEEPDEVKVSRPVLETSRVGDSLAEFNNHLALKYLRTMQPTDEVLIYHTGSERRGVGVAEIVPPPYTDPVLRDPLRVVVDVRAVRSLPQPVTLAQIKQSGNFTDFDLIRLPRLSVVPVPTEYWQRILQLAGE